MVGWWWMGSCLVNVSIKGAVDWISLQINMIWYENKKTNLMDWNVVGTSQILYIVSYRSDNMTYIYYLVVLIF